MRRGQLVNGFQYLIMLSLCRHGKVGVGQIVVDLESATGESVSKGGVSATLKTLEGHGNVARHSAPPTLGEGRGIGSRRLFDFELTETGTARLNAMTQAVGYLSIADDAMNPALVLAAVERGEGEVTAYEVAAAVGNAPLSAASACSVQAVLDNLEYLGHVERTPESAGGKICYRLTKSGKLRLYWFIGTIDRLAGSGAALEE